MATGVQSVEPTGSELSVVHSFKLNLSLYLCQHDKPLKINVAKNAQLYKYNYPD